jgi:hypothetical protein
MTKKNWWETEPDNRDAFARMLEAERAKPSGRAPVTLAPGIIPAQEKVLSPYTGTRPVYQAVEGDHHVLEGVAKTRQTGPSINGQRFTYDYGRNGGYQMASGTVVAVVQQRDMWDLGNLLRNTEGVAWVDPNLEFLIVPNDAKVSSHQAWLGRALTPPSVIARQMYEALAREYGPGIFLLMQPVNQGISYASLPPGKLDFAQDPVPDIAALDRFAKSLKGQYPQAQFYRLQ